MLIIYPFFSKMKKDISKQLTVTVMLGVIIVNIMPIVHVQVG